MKTVRSFNLPERPRAAGMAKLAMTACMTACMAACMVVPGTASAQAPAEFAWRATLEVPPQASLVRAALPAEALLRLRSAQAADVRVFDAKGQPVPFALTAPVDQPRPARQATAFLNALPLFSARSGLRVPASGVQLRVDQGGQQRSVWVQMDGATSSFTAAAGATPLQSALFDARGLEQSITAVVIKARLPANAPVGMTLSSSTDLAQWTPVPLRGRLYRFEGNDAPANGTLELDTPLVLKGHYLRLDWQGQDGVEVESLQGLIAPAQAQLSRLTAALPEPRRDGAQAIEWELATALPLSALTLATSRANTLVPVRVMGRNQASEPWRQLTQGVVFRLGSGAEESANSTLTMPRVAARWLRVEATLGQR
ncbi:MAG: DUF3999 family protein, partial [Bdellovibrionales bacterium]|nr:DUF3999 family protein [Ramlibacter sp.]